jgi:RsiW-degrading membrane proteinase PrsW (M82 family)
MNTTVDLSAVTFECIDGKDDHYQVVLRHGQSILFGCATSGTAHSLKELQGHKGSIIITNTGGLLQINASECTLPVKINGKRIVAGLVLPADIVKIGNSLWKAFPVNAGNAQPLNKYSSFTRSIGDFMGLEELKDFRLRNLFSHVFKKHTFEDTEEQLVTGTSNHTPSITEIEVSWAKPWLFSRLIVLSIVLTLLLVVGYNMFRNDNLIPGLIFIGTFVMPFATVIFFMEVNAPRNVSIFLVLLLLFAGGVASLLITLIVSDKLSVLYRTFKDSAAALIEEPVKLLIVILVLGKYRRYPWVLNGLLLGAAVGAGFGAFESAGYAYRSTSFPSMVNNIIIRGLLAPFMHVVWTANAAAALWMVKGEKPFQWSMLASPKFLRVFILSVVTHFAWNAEGGMFTLPWVGDVKYLLLGFLSWTVCFMLIQTGLKQLNEARHAEVERLRAA